MELPETDSTFTMRLREFMQRHKATGSEVRVLCELDQTTVVGVVTSIGVSGNDVVYTITDANCSRATAVLERQIASFGLVPKLCETGALKPTQLSFADIKTIADQFWGMLREHAMGVQLDDPDAMAVRRESFPGLLAATLGNPEFSKVASSLGITQQLYVLHDLLYSAQRADGAQREKFLGQGRVVLSTILSGGVGETRMTVIDEEQWEPCSPRWIGNGGCCASAPRVWSDKTNSHWHPKLHTMHMPAPQPKKPDFFLVVDGQGEVEALIPASAGAGAATSFMDTEREQGRDTSSWLVHDVSIILKDGK